MPFDDQSHRDTFKFAQMGAFHKSPKPNHRDVSLNNAGLSRAWSSKGDQHADRPTQHGEGDYNPQQMMQMG